MLGIMAIYVVPRFQVFYDAMAIERLPALTRLTLGTGHFLRANLVYLIAGAAIGYVALDRWSRTAAGRVALARFRLALPVLGGVFHRFAISEYCRSLSTLLAGGLPLVQALEISTRGVGNAWIRSQLEPVVARVREGHALHHALEQSGAVPELAVDMVEVGEATGALDQMLSNVSGFLDEEVETRMQRLLSLIEPILLLVVGGLVAVLLVSVYLPIFSALSSVS
jgi:type IV pilus assembly protein PilC